MRPRDSARPSAGGGTGNGNDTIWGKAGPAPAGEVSEMCGRFYLDVSREQLQAHYGLSAVPDDLKPRYNIAPSQDILAVREARDHERELVRLHWGLIPAWAKEEKTHYSMINARAETVASKPAYRNAFRRRRCLIPANGFYEWRQEGKFKQPYAIERKDHGLFSMAGLWEHWEGNDDKVIESCSIIVTDANDLLKPIHDRMPAIIPPDEYERWLDPECQEPEQLLELLRPYPADAMRAYPVSRRVNNPAIDEPSLLEPLGKDD